MGFMMSVKSSSKTFTSTTATTTASTTSATAAAACTLFRERASSTAPYVEPNSHQRM